MSDTLDHRLNAYRPDLADRRLAGQVEAAAFAEGQLAHVVAPVAGLRREPSLKTGIDTQALMGEEVRIFDRADGWAWVQLAADSYVGYVPEDALAAGAGTSTHVVSRQRSFVYPGPDLRFPIVTTLSMGSRINVVGNAETRGTGYVLLADGTAMIAAHCRPIGETGEADPVSVAALMLETPYLWGGRSGFGIDCSGLVQMALAMTGRAAPRDSDQQAASLGVVIDPASDGLRRGDLVFWKGHVAMMEDAGMMLHASGGTMTVTREPLADAIARIMPLYGAPTRYRRP